jgi:hypothetical protein
VVPKGKLDKFRKSASQEQVIEIHLTTVPVTVVI